LVDNCNNAAATQVQIITVSDNTVPTFTAPLDITIYTTANCTYDASVAATGDVTNEADNCSTGIQATYSDAMPVAIVGCHGGYTIARTWSLVDNCGNAAATQLQTITVRDNTLPTFTAPSDITIYTTANCTYDASIVVTGDVTNEADNCSIGIQATYSDAAPVAIAGCQGGYTIARTWSLEDNCNNVATQVQIITVSDNTVPTFTAPSDITIYTTANCTYDASVAATGDVTNEADNCSTGIQATFNDVVTDGPCEGSKVITRTWSLVDNCGNAAATQVQIITVSDNTVPTFTAPSDITIYTTANCTYDASVAATGDVTNEADNCSTGLSATFTDVLSYTTPGSKKITRTWSLVDACGNAAANQVQIISIVDTTKPVIACPAAFTALANTTGCLYTGSIGTATASDNCSIKSIIATPAGPYPAGVTVVTWTATDSSGNTATCTQTVTITKEPVVILATSSTNLYTNDLLDMEITSPTGGSAYGWAGPSGGSLSSTDEFLSGTVSSIDSGIYVATVTDALGCVNTASILVQVHASAVVRLKALLSGPYVATAGLMHDSLRTYGIIPTTDPYTAAPFNTIFPKVGMPSPSSSVDPSVFIPTGPDAIVDWVFIQLRSAANASTVVATRSALIQRDGDIVALDGVSPVTFQGTYPGSYFVTVKHRNHLGIMTAGSINILENGTAVDFTNPGTPLYLRAAPNNNPSPLSGAVRVTGGKNVMYAGNCNLGGPSAAYSRYITYSNSPVSDRTTLFAAVGLSGSFNGYSVLDVDMSGSARFNGFNPDRVVILLNCANNSSGLIVHEQTPN
jgi:hypothetical protein